MNNCCETIEVDVLGNDALDVDVLGDNPIDVDIEGSSGSPGRYPPLLEKPSINGIVLLGNKTFKELGDHTLTNIEIKAIFDRVFGGE